ncbi:MAG TPA: prephenate dehydratase [Lacipirellulaceae bacterium]|nr:prephenate dehydratase [Lacipirellulaceae bacterium]
MAKRKHSKLTKPDASLAELRRELDRVDRELVAAINLRAEIARQIGALKRDKSQILFDPAREAEVLQQAQHNNPGPLTNAAVRAVFREIVSGSRAVQAATRVAYLGPEFTFSHLAAIEGFGQSAELVPVGSIAAVFEEVERGQVQFGVVPMENSTDGRVSDTLECFSRFKVRICAGIPLRIHHCLLGVGARDELQTVYSKPQPLSQCRNWLARHLPQAELRETSSTAGAAKAAKDDRQAAAVASAQAAAHYGIPVLVPNIEDNPNNVTRFVVISTATSQPTGHDKTTVLFEVAHKPGALVKAMMNFERNGLNMTMIDSYPVPGSLGRYLFFIEFVGHEEDPPVRRALASLRKKAHRVEVLGSYAQAEPIG